MAQQQGDVQLFQTLDDGDISVTGGIVAMSGGLETAAYLSLFGGNEADDGRPDNVRNWWANIGELDPTKRYRSETQNLLQAIPAVPRNLLRIESAAKRDLAWFTEVGAASLVEVSAGIPGVNRIQITVRIVAEGSESDFVFSENWKATE